MKKFSELNNFAKNRLAFTDNRTPRVVLRYNSAPNIEERLFETSFPFKTTIEVTEIIRPADSLPALSIEFNVLGATIDFVLPVGITKTTTTRGYLLTGFTTVAQWNTVVNNAIVNAPADFQGSLVYTVELYWFEPARKSISHTVGTVIPVGELSTTSSLTVTARTIFGGIINMNVEFGVRAFEFIEGSAALSAAFGVTAPNKIYTGNYALLTANVGTSAIPFTIKPLSAEISTQAGTALTATPIYGELYLTRVAEPQYYDSLSEQDISSVSPRLTGISDSVSLDHTMEIFSNNIELVDNFRIDGPLLKDLRLDFNQNRNKIVGAIANSQIVWGYEENMGDTITRYDVTTNSFAPISTAMVDLLPTANIEWNPAQTRFAYSDPFFDNDKGKIVIYRIDPAGYIIIERTLLGTALNDRLGEAFSFVGNNFLIHSKQSNINTGSGPGEVIIRQNVGDTWNQVASLIPPTPSDSFGIQLAGNRDTSSGKRYIVKEFYNFSGSNPLNSRFYFYNDDTSINVTLNGFTSGGPDPIGDDKFDLIAIGSELFDWSGNSISSPDGRIVHYISPLGNYIVTQLGLNFRVWKKLPGNTWIFIQEFTETGVAKVTSITNNESTIIVTNYSTTSGYVKKYTIVDGEYWTFNDLTKKLTLTGNKGQINNMLDNLRFTSNLINNDYIMNYKLTSVDPAVVYTRRVDYEPLDGKMTMGITSSLSCNGIRILGSISNLLSLTNLTAKGTGGRIISDPITLSSSFSASCANSFMMFGDSTVPLRGESFTSGLNEFWFAGISTNTVQNNGIQTIFVSDIIDNDLLLMPSGFSYTNTTNNVSFYDELCHKTYSTSDVTPYQFRAPQTGSYLSKTLIFEKNPNRYRVSSTLTGTGNTTTQSINNVSAVAGDLFISIVVGKMPNVPIDSYTMNSGFRLIDIRRQGNLFMAIAGITWNTTGTFNISNSWTFNTSQPINNWRQTFMALR